MQKNSYSSKNKIREIEQGFLCILNRVSIIDGIILISIDFRKNGVTDAYSYK
ncbi:hypothetical protein SDC9_164654 [bioreactor metagenome]|uniref:Uncharacterized protein n=1 Tax=bioreactor metagenome TaxID=1076179 RepID=A0A645FS84_9ZZZZ